MSCRTLRWSLNGLISLLLRRVCPWSRNSGMRGRTVDNQDISIIIVTHRHCSRAPIVVHISVSFSLDLNKIPD